MGAAADPVEAVAALQLPLRRHIYEFVAAQAEGASRDMTAEAVEVARSVAAFNLDKLAEVGLLEVEYRRPAGRGGPGAGRPAKWYRRSAADVAVSVPGRRYDLAAAILAEAMDQPDDAAGTAPSRSTVEEVARRHGRRLAATLAGATADREALLQLLAEHGYEPQEHRGVVAMANCPFHALVEDHRDLVCHLNRGLLTGVAEAAGLSAGAATLDPAPHRCCVTLALARGGAKRPRP